MYASHSIVQDNETPLMCAAQYNESAQALAIVERLLVAKAEVNATDRVSAWEGYMDKYEKRLTG